MRFNQMLAYWRTQILLQLNEKEKRNYEKGSLTANKASLPNFLTIGAQKAGTTWLYENLRCHPSIFIPDKRAIHYFDDHFYQTLETYATHFAQQESKVRGEVMPGYGLIPERRIRFINHILPELKLIFLMRNPIERAWSHALMSFQGHQNQLVENVSEEAFIQHFHSKLSMQKGDYLNIIDKWLKFFPKEALFVGFIDDVQKQPTQLLNAVFKHIGASTIDDFNTFKIFDKVNAREKRSIPPGCLNELKSIYREDIHQLYERFGSPVDQWIGEYYR